MHEIVASRAVRSQPETQAPESVSPRAVHVQTTPTLTNQADQNVVPPHVAPAFKAETALVKQGGRAQKNVEEFMSEALYPSHKPDEGLYTAVVKSWDRVWNRLSRGLDFFMPLKKSQAAATATGAVIGGLIGLIAGPPGVVLGAMIGSWLGGKARSNVHEAIAEGAARSRLQESKLDQVVNLLIPSSSSKELQALKGKYDAAKGKLHLKLMIFEDIQKLTPQEVDLSMLGPDPEPQYKPSPLKPGHVAGGGGQAAPLPPKDPVLALALNQGSSALTSYQEASKIFDSELMSSTKELDEARNLQAASKKNLESTFQLVRSGNIAAEQRGVEIPDLENAWRLEIQILTALGGQGLAAARQRHEAVRKTREEQAKT